MQTKLKLAFSLWLIFVVLNFLNCSGSDDSDQIEELRLVEIIIDSSNGDRLDLSGTASTSLSLSGLDQYAEEYIINGTISWTSNNFNASVSQTGLVNALEVGVSIIQVEAEGVTASFTISIWDSSAPRTEIFVSEVENLNDPPYKILRYFADGSFSEVFTNQNLAWPQDIVILEDQEVVLISNLNTGRITKYNLNTGDYIENFATGIGQPTRMKIGADNLLYVLQWAGDGLVRRYNLDGSFVDNFTSVAVPQSIGMDWDADGNLYVSSFQNANVRKFDSQGNDLGVFANANMVGPTNIWFDAEGNLLVNDWNAGRVARFNPNGAFIDIIINGLSQPEGVDFLSNGHFLIGNGGPGEVKEFMPDGTFVKNIIAAGGDLKQPNAVIVRNVN
ncbi:MAG: hypothetical protein HWE21_11130 [Cytophagia bacterium]|nr:hypothetical protein [Cytophagia bacterium]